MSKYFLVGVADVYGYDSSDNLLFVGKTLLDSTIEATLSNTDIRAGKGNALQYVYYHSSDLKVTINDAQFNLDFLAQNIGSTITTGKDVWTEETVTLDAAKGGSVVATPLVISGATPYGWVRHADGTTERVEFATKAFTCSTGSENDQVCVRFFANNSSARSVTLKANTVPNILRLVMDAQLCNSESSTNVVGKVQIEFPHASLTGAWTLNLKADSVSSTPLNARVFSVDSTSGSCTSADAIYGYITEILTSYDWTSDVTGLAIEGGDSNLANAATKQLRVYAVMKTGAPKYLTLAENTSDITWASSDASKATVSSAGLVTWAAAGPTTIKATLKDNTAIDANVVITATA